MSEFMSKTICVFGDSISEGYYDSKNGGWVSLLKKKLSLQSLDYNVHNFSVSGYSTKEVLKVFDVTAGFVDPDLIIVMIGVNDSSLIKNKKSNLTLKQFSVNITKLIEKAKIIGSEIVFISNLKVNETLTKPVNWDKTCYYNNQLIEMCNNAIESLTKRNNCLFIDVYSLLAKKDLFDGVHPNTLGHAKLFRKVYNKVKPILYKS